MRTRTGFSYYLSKMGKQDLLINLADASCGRLRAVTCSNSLKLNKLFVIHFYPSILKESPKQKEITIKLKYKVIDSLQKTEGKSNSRTKRFLESRFSNVTVPVSF